VNGAKGIAVADGCAEVRRERAAGFELYRLALPAMVGVLEGINLPRYATLPGRLRSKKAEVPVRDVTPTPDVLRSLGFEVPADEETETRVLGEGPGAAPAVVDLLEELGLL
jgi:electron transfer flavoprotein beta subunit